ncbi:MAG: hypothetical protein ABH826_02165 [Patescibacteria group bacterium]
MMEGLEYSIVIAAFWFPIYWVFGGVFFATIAFLKVIKLRKVRFSCLFTLSSLAAAYGASYLGMRLGEGEIDSCLSSASGFLDRISAIIGCGILSLFLAGGIGFIVLLGLGMIILYISRAANQSWIDSDEGVREKTNLMFDLE